MIELVIGYSGAILTAVGMAAQVRHSLKTRNYKDLSRCRLFTDILTNSLYLTYGGMTKNVPIIITSASVVSASVFLSIASRMDSD